MRHFDMPFTLGITELAWPTRVVLGPKALKRAPAELARLSIRRPLIVTDSGVVKAGIAGKLLALLEEAALPVALFDQVKTDPTEADAERGLEVYREQHCDGLVAIGGGSVLDAAKLVQLRVTHQAPLSKYDDAAGGADFVRGDLPPLVAIPTTAGTGSEVSRSSVALLSDTGRKTVIFSPHLLPKAAICDPELTLGLPAHLTAATGMDALTHCVEAYLATGFHPLADAVAIDGIQRVARSLPTAVKAGNELHARTDLMIAAMQGAMAFQKGLGAAHSLAHALTPVSGLHHGLANAIVLPTVMEFNRGACTARLAKVAAALGDSSWSRQEVLAANAIDRVRRLNEEIGIPSKLRDAGVKEADLPKIARKAFEDASHRTNPRRCSEEELLAVARAAF